VIEVLPLVFEQKTVKLQHRGTLIVSI